MGGVINMNNMYCKKSDVIRSLFDYLEGKKTIGQCIDDVPAIDIDDVVKLLEEEKVEQAIEILTKG